VLTVLDTTERVAVRSHHRVYALRAVTAIGALHHQLGIRGFHTNGKADYWTYIQEAIWSMSSDDEDQQSYLKSSSLVSP